MKKLLIIIFNFMLIVLLLIFSDFLVYKYYALITTRIYNPFPNYNIVPVSDNKIFYDNINKFFNYLEKDNNKDYPYDINNYTGRPPDGLEYKNKIPVIIFGCSFAYGAFLKNSQTFSRKLSQILKRPVFNRAIPGGSFQQMYMQTIQDKLYEEIPYSDTIIYVMMQDHYRRLKVRNFEVLEPWEGPVFKIKNKKLFHLSRNSIIINYLRNSYISRHFNHVLTNKYIKNTKNSQKLTDEVLLYFLESRRELKKHYGNDLKFYVIFYSNITYSDILKKKLEYYGFKTISTDELTNQDLNSPKYVIPNDGHPSEAAWDLLTPLIIEKMNEKK